jgi:probable HAF family extracellular repeat protein
MKFVAQIFLSLIVTSVFSGGSLLNAATPIEIVDNLGVATPSTQFGAPGSAGLTISPRQFVGPQFILTAPTLITEIGGFLEKVSQIIDGVLVLPSPLPFKVQIRPADMNGFPDPIIVLSEFILSTDNDIEIISYESVAPNIILGPGTYFALFTPQTSPINDVGRLLDFATNPFDYRGEAAIVIGSFNPSTGLPVPVPPHLDLARSAVRILGIAPVSRLVSIDVRPRSDTNRLDPDSNREINVAILSLDGFNALTVDPNTVRFGATGNEAAPVDVARRDVDGNGQRDMVLRFEIQDTEIECGDTSATLTGQTFNGESILGSGAIKTVQCYTFTTIDVPRSIETSAANINARGQIVGVYADINGGHGFLLDSGLFATIDAPGARFTVPTGINDRRQIVGIDIDIVNRGHGFLWDSGVFTRIDFPGARETGLRDINNRGQIIGSYVDAGGRDQSFLWENGVFTPIDFPGASFTSANGINNRGQIVGNYQDANLRIHGFLLDNGVFTTIDAPGAAVSTTADINDRGQIVGFHDGGPTGGTHFLLSDGQFISLDFPDALSIAALGINARGEIVGQARDGEGGIHGFLATRARSRGANMARLPEF